VVVLYAQMLYICKYETKERTERIHKDRQRAIQATVRREGLPVHDKGKSGWALFNCEKTVSRPANIENLKPFKKGEDERRNIKGRPKLPDLKEAIAKVLNKEKNGKTALDEILDALWAKAAKGDVRAAQELMDRGFGKAQQFTDITTGGDKINITINPV